MRCRVYITVGCPFVCLSVCLSLWSTSAACRTLRLGVGSRYRSTAAGARAAAAGSVMLRAEVRDSTQICFTDKFDITVLDGAATHVHVENQRQK